MSRKRLVLRFEPIYNPYDYDELNDLAGLLREEKDMITSDNTDGRDKLNQV